MCSDSNSRSYLKEIKGGEMRFEDQQVCLELSKQLKKAGYKQEGLWWHYQNKLWSKFDVTYKYFRPMSFEEAKKKFKVYVAPTVAEMGLALPNTINTIKDKVKGQIMFCCGFDSGKYKKYSVQAQIANTEADARAKMWLYLKKKGLI